MTQQQRPRGPELTRRQAALLAASLGSLALLALVPGLLAGETFYLRDIAPFGRPMRELLVDLWSSSEGLPLWNPHANHGQPFAANPNSAVFHPFSLLFWLLPVERAFQLQFLLPIPIAGLSMAYLLRVSALSRLGSLFGALCWAFGGVTLSLCGFFQLGATACLLPATLAFCLRLVRSSRPVHLAGAMGCFGLQCLGGAPSMLVATAIALAVLVPAEWLRARRLESAAGAPSRLALSLGVGLLLGAAVLVPALGLASSSSRGANMYEGDAWSFPPLRFAELVAPKAMGHVSADESVRAYWSQGAYEKAQWPYLLSVHPGLLVTLLALIAMARRPRRLVPWAVLALLGTALAMGEHLGLHDALGRVVLPLQLVRYPEKLFVLPALALVVSASAGFDWLRRSRAIRRDLVVSLLGVMLIALLLAPLGGNFLPLDEHALAFSTDMRFLALLALALATCLALARRERQRRLARILLVVLSVAALVHSGRELTPTMPVEQAVSMPEPLRPLLPPAGEDFDGYLFHVDWVQDLRPHAPGAHVMHPVPSRWGIGSAHAGDFDRTQYAWTTEARTFAQAITTRFPRIAGAFLARASVSAVLRERNEADRRAGLEQFELLQPRHSQPLAFAAERAEVVADETERATRLLALGEQGRSTVLLEESPASEPLPRPVGPAETRFLERRPGRWSLEVSVPGPQPAVVALNQTWAPGWEARIDDEPAELLRAEMALQALVVPPGEHRLDLRYREPLVTLGLVISALGLVLAAWFVTRARR